MQIANHRGVGKREYWSTTSMETHASAAVLQRLWICYC